MGLNSDLNRTASNLQFAEIRTPGELLDGSAIQIAGGEIHLRKAATISQHGVDESDAFEDFRPIDIGHATHAGDNVSDGDVGCDLSLLFIVDRCVYSLSACGQQLVDVGEERLTDGP